MLIKSYTLVPTSSQLNVDDVYACPLFMLSFLFVSLLFFFIIKMYKRE